MALYSVADIASMSDSQKSVLINPASTFVYVEVGDIDGVNYVAGSAGSLKQVLEYLDSAKTRLSTTTTFKYENATYPTKITSSVVA